MVTHPFPEKPEISNEDTATEVVEAPSFKIQHCSPASSLHRHSSEYDNQQSPLNSFLQLHGAESVIYNYRETEDSGEDTATEHADDPLFQIQHCSPAFFLHLHYFEDFNEEGAEFEVDGYSPCQQSSSAPSFQISESE
jgi:hypothetical protein